MSDKKPVILPASFFEVEEVDDQKPAEGERMSEGDFNERFSPRTLVSKEAVSYLLAEAKRARAAEKRLESRIERVLALCKDFDKDASDAQKEITALKAEIKEANQLLETALEELNTFYNKALKALKAPEKTDAQKS